MYRYSRRCVGGGVGLEVAKDIYFMPDFEGDYMYAVDGSQNNAPLIRF